MKCYVFEVLDVEMFFFYSHKTILGLVCKVWENVNLIDESITEWWVLKQTFPTLMLAKY